MYIDGRASHMADTTQHQDPQAYEARGLGAVAPSLGRNGQYVSQFVLKCQVIFLFRFFKEYS